MAEKNSWSTKTYQSGIKGSEADGTGLGRGVVSADQITKYALFQGGLNATHDSLTQYDPFKTGFGRIFMVRQPQIMVDFNGGNDIRILKHLIEYANTGISGFGNIELKTSDMQGGYSNRSIKIPTISDDTGMQDFTIELYELAGQPVSRTIKMWINGISDLQSGLAHSNGTGVEPTLANQTAEFIYCVTDATGRYDRIEYACMLACCLPTSIDQSYLESKAGDHDVVKLQLKFSCIKYESPKINEVAKLLMQKYNVLVNSLDFHPGMVAGADNNLHNSSDGSTLLSENTMYNPTNGQIETLKNIKTTNEGKEHLNNMIKAGYYGFEDVDDINATPNPTIVS